MQSSTGLPKRTYDTNRLKRRPHRKTLLIRNEYIQLKGAKPLLEKTLALHIVEDVRKDRLLLTISAHFGKTVWI